MRNNTYRALGIALLATLTACGGGGGGGGGGFPIAPIAVTPPPAANPDPVPQDPVLPALSLDFQLLTNEYDPVKLLATLNSEGSEGFRWEALLNFGTYSSYFFFNDTATTEIYTNEFLAVGLNKEDFLTQVNARGAHGFRLVSDGSLRKNSAVTAWYSYTMEISLRRTATNTYPESLDAFLTQLNAQGAKGSRFIGEKYFAPIEEGRYNIHSVYEKAGDTLYEYEVLPKLVKDADFIAQLNAQGARGFRFNFTSSLKNGDNKVFYVKDKAQTSKFTYWIVDRPGDASGFLAQLKDNASRGKAMFIDEYSSGTDSVSGPGSVTGKSKVIYSASEQCKGALCDGLHTFSINSTY